MINLQSDIGPLYTVIPQQQSLRYIAPRRLPNCYNFETLGFRKRDKRDSLWRTQCRAYPGRRPEDSVRLLLSPNNTSPLPRPTKHPSSDTIYNHTHTPFSPTARAYNMYIARCGIDLYCTHAHNVSRVYIHNNNIQYIIIVLYGVIRWAV